MTKRLQRDFTQGSIPRHLLLFAWPMLVSNLLQILHNVIDSVWVGRFVGPHALGTVSVSFPLVFALLSLVIGITMATSILIAQYRGAGNEEMVRRTVANSAMLLSMGGILFATIGIVFRYPLLRLIQTPPEILDMSANYFAVTMAGMPVIFIYFAAEAILRGLGDSRTPLTFMMVSTFTNIVLSPLMIIGVGPFPAWGVVGAGVATVISQIITSVLIIRWMLRHTDLVQLKRSFWRWDSRVTSLIFKIGIPAGLQMIFVSFSMVVVVSLVNNYGTEVTAAFGAATKFDQIAILPSMSMGAAVGALVGQNLGAGKFDRVSSIVRWSSGMAAIVTGAVSLVAILAPGVLLKLFTTEQIVLTEGSAYLRIVGASYILIALTNIVAAVLRGAGDTTPALIITIITLWVLRVPLSWYLSNRIGVNGIWYGIAISSAVGLLLTWGYYQTGLWRKRVTVRSGAPSAQPVSAD